MLDFLYLTSTESYLCTYSYRKIKEIYSSRC